MPKLFPGYHIELKIFKKHEHKLPEKAEITNFSRASVFLQQVFHECLNLRFVIIIKMIKLKNLTKPVFPRGIPKDGIPRVV